MNRCERVPATLSRGDTVGVVAPGFAVRRAALDAGVARLRAMGFRVRVGDYVLARHGYLAGSDDQRASDLNSMLCDPEIRAVWFARGGYGTARLLDGIPWRKLRSQPKLLVGYSDLTALFAAAGGRSGATCLYGPVVTELGDPASHDAPSLRAALAGRPTTLRVRRRQVVAGGSARGPLVGGNLTVLNHLLGTRFAPRFDGAVLFVEDRGEPVYRIDRMLTQFRQAGAFRRIAGVLIGGLDTPPRRRFPPDRSLPDLLRETFGSLGVPVVGDLPAGHVPRKRTLPLGATVELDADGRRVRFVP